MPVKNKKIRVMHINSYIGYDGPSRGILGQIKYTNKEIFQPIICEIKSSRHPELIKFITDMGCEHVSLNKNKPYDLSVIIRLAMVFKKNAVDIVNTHNAIACWYGNIAAKIARIPVVFTLRNNQAVNYKFLLRSNILAKIPIWLDRYTMNMSDIIVAVSDRLRKYYISKEGIPSNKILTIENAIDLEPFYKKHECLNKENRKKIGINENVIVIGMVGDLVERKGHVYLIEAARIITKSFNNIIFLICGDGPLKESLIKKTKDYRISKYFIWTGHVKNVFLYMSVMDIFVLPSFAEGISRALIESMAMGIPSVVSNIDGNSEAVVDGETGLIFPLQSYTILAEKLLVLINDERRRKEMGKNAKRRAEELFDMRKYAAKYETLYLELLEGRTGSLETF